MIKKQRRVFLNAVMFFTRIPCPEIKDFQESEMEQSRCYFSLIGILVGAIGFGVFYGATFILPTPVAIILSLTATLLTTGALHEDGFADMVDGFGGGWKRERILEIMKDSHIGAFGVIALILLFALKFTLLLAILPQLNGLYTLALFLCMHSLSRACASILMYQLKYVREESSSKVKSLTTPLSSSSLAMIMFFGLLPLLLFQPHWKLTLAAIPCVVAALIMGLYIKKKIGGYTGDCLGATQQVCELVFLMTITAYLQ